MSAKKLSYVDKQVFRLISLFCVLTIYYEIAITYLEYLGVVNERKSKHVAIS